MQAQVVANPLAAAGATSSGVSAVEAPAFRRRLRRRTVAPDVGFATFTSGIRAGWEVEYASVKFRQVRGALSLLQRRLVRVLLPSHAHPRTPTHTRALALTCVELV